MFSPQRVPRENSASRANPVLALRPELVLPWSMPLFASSAGDKVWRFTLYAGLYSEARVRSVLYRHFGREPQSFDQHSNGRSCLFALQVTDEGRPLFDTLTVSSCPWAVGRTLKPGHANAEWLEGFDAFADEQRRYLEQAWAVEEDDEIGRELRKNCRIGKPLGSGDILAAIETLARALGVVQALRPEGARIAGHQVRKQKTIESDSHDF
jgi:hypothetical protein